MGHFAVSERWYSALGSKNAFLPSLNNDMLQCIPEPLIPYTGFGINVAWSPYCAAIALTATLKVTTLSAVVNISEYLKLS